MNGILLPDYKMSQTNEMNNVITTDVITTDEVTQAIVIAAKRIRKPSPETVILNKIVEDLRDGKFAEDAAGLLKNIFGDKFCITKGLMEAPKKEKKVKEVKVPKEIKEKKTKEVKVPKEKKEKKVKVPKEPKEKKVKEQSTIVEDTDTAAAADDKPKKEKKPRKKATMPVEESVVVTVDESLTGEEVATVATTIATTEATEATEATTEIPKKEKKPRKKASVEPSVDDITEALGDMAIENKTKNKSTTTTTEKKSKKKTTSNDEVVVVDESSAPVASLTPVAPVAPVDAPKKKDKKEKMPKKSTDKLQEEVVAVIPDEFSAEWTEELVEEELSDIEEE